VRHVSPGTARPNASRFPPAGVLRYFVRIERKMALEARPEKRLHRRFPITLDVQYKLLNRSRVKRFGSGRTINISSSGIFFESQNDLPTRGSIELILDWPLEGVANRKLIVRGQIVRRDALGTAVKMTRHKFYTSESSVRNAEDCVSLIRKGKNR
jgi:hypothetical protein